MILITRQTSTSNHGLRLRDMASARKFGHFRHDLTDSTANPPEAEAFLKPEINSTLTACCLQAIDNVAQRLQAELRTAFEAAENLYDVALEALTAERGASDLDLAAGDFRETKEVDAATFESLFLTATD